jgi:hypothetical protein
LTALRKVVTASALALVLSAAVPTHLLAAEREAPATLRAATAAEWLSTLWHDLAALFAAGTTPPHIGSGGGPTTQGSCAVDPYGGCANGG